MNKVALAHHWAVSMRGGEKVLEQLAILFPHADIHTLVHRRDKLSATLGQRKFHSSPLQHRRWTNRLYKQLLPLHPSMISTMRVDADVDWLVSSDSSMIKGLPRSSWTRQVCYCHSPPRYVWEMADQYGTRFSPTKIGLTATGPLLRRFDRSAAHRVDSFIANSKFVQRRIRRYYDRDSVVIAPPVDVQSFRCDQPRQDFLLVVSELTAYKRVDLAVQAASRLGRRLVVIGDGPERSRLESMAGRTVEFLGRTEWQTVVDHMQTATALLFPGIEDFGMTPVESQAAGCPVIAYADGGALETVTDCVHGVLFPRQSVDALCDAIKRLDNLAFDPASLRQAARRFDVAAFRTAMTSHLRSIGVAMPIPSTSHAATAPTAQVAGAPVASVTKPVLAGRTSSSNQQTA